MCEKYFSLSYLGVTFMAFDVSIAVNGQKLLYLLQQGAVSAHTYKLAKTMAVSSTLGQ